MAPVTAALLQRTHTSSNATFSGRQQEASSFGQHYFTAPAPHSTALRRSPLRPAVSVHRRQQPGLAWQRVCLARGKAFCGPGSLEKVNNCLHGQSISSKAAGSLISVHGGGLKVVYVSKQAFADDRGTIVYFIQAYCWQQSNVTPCASEARRIPPAKLLTCILVL